MIELKEVTKIYNKGINPFFALNKIDLFIKEGEFVSIVGRSGSGKSTLLNILGCLDTFDQGEYSFNGKNTIFLKGKQLAVFRGQNIGYIYQAFHLIPELNLIENVAVPLGYAGVKAEIRRKKALQLLEKVGLKDKVYQKPNQLSGGEQQRTAIARALISEPPLLLADEPTGNLDRKNSEEVINLLKECHHNGRTVIIVTHDMEIAAHANRCITLIDGKIVSDKTQCTFNTNEGV